MDRVLPFLGLAISIWLSFAGNKAMSQAFPRHPGLNLPRSISTDDWKMSENAFGNVRFNGPISISHAPDETDNIYVLERSIGVTRFNVETRTKSSFLNLSSRIDDGGEGGILGLAFHPRYKENGYIFVFYTLRTSNGSGNGFHTRISRFTSSLGSSPRVSTSTERVLISQFNQASNHNGGDIHFGPDGYLYAALGDEGQANDSLRNSQKIDKDFFAGIIRIDVDELEENLTPNPHPAFVGNYKIPKDNPYVGATSFNGQSVDPSEVRTEFWAVGLRNPWRMSFDKTTGLLYTGDVGQGLREEINIIEKGGNYGWFFREGFVGGPASSPIRDFINPIHDYRHGSASTQGRSVTGGLVYRGDNYPELFGKYIFGDYVSGNIWALESDGSRRRVPSDHLVGGVRNISSFNYDPTNGDILGTALTRGIIVRLERDENSAAPEIPEKLSETGIFSSTEDLVTAEGVVNYKLNHPFWSDNALKTRWVVLPRGTSKVDLDGRDGLGRFPARTVFVKHFELELEEGNPESRTRLETRIIYKTNTYVYGLTYKWDQDQKDATLVDATGEEEIYTVTKDGESTEQLWTFPSRAACLHCHSRASGGVLGFSKGQLARDSQLSDFEKGEIVSFLKPREFDRRIVGLDAPDANINEKAASYLHVNCAPCHQPGGPAVGDWDARISTPLWKKKLLFGQIVRQENPNESFVLEPGQPEKSAIIGRLTSQGPGKMPPIGSHVIDQRAVDLLSEWITTDLKDIAKPSQTWEVWYQFHFSESPDGFEDAGIDSDKDGTADFLEYLLSTDPNDPSEGWRFGVQRTEAGLILNFNPIPSNGLMVNIQKSTSPTGPWENVNVSPDNDSDWSQELDVSGEDNNFFRVILREP